MIARGTGAMAILFGSLFLTVPSTQADAASSSRPTAAQRGTQAQPAAATTRARKPVRAAARRGGGLQCVPYARAQSGIQITGNAHTWWRQAAGLYERGQTPERGAVMSFPSIQRMRLGHVAVVSQVISPREVLIDHANWAGPRGRKGQITRGVSVIDVSPRNDWTSVRVANAPGQYGSVYPLNGFIYARQDSAAGTAYAAARPARATAAAHARALAGEAVPFEELAEAPTTRRNARR